MLKQDYYNDCFEFGQQKMNFSFFEFYRITIHVLQLNNEKARIGSFVLYLNHHKTKIYKGVSLHGKYNTKYEILSFTYYICRTPRRFQRCQKIQDQPPVCLLMEEPL